MEYYWYTSVSLSLKVLYIFIYLFRTRSARSSMHYANSSYKTVGDGISDAVFFIASSDKYFIYSTV